MNVSIFKYLGLSLLAISQLSLGAGKLHDRVFQKIVRSDFVCVVENLEPGNGARVSAAIVTRTLKGRPPLEFASMPVARKGKTTYLVYGQDAAKFSAVRIGTDGKIVFPVKEGDRWIQIVFTLELVAKELAKGVSAK